MPTKRTDSRDASPDGRTVRRRRFIRTVGATGVSAGIAGCSGGGGGDGDGGTGGDGGGGTTTGGGGDGSSSGTTIEFVAHDEWANVQDTVNQQLHDAGMPEDITVEMSTVGQTTDDQQSQYRQWLSAGRATPDMMIFDSGWTIPFIARGQLLNLEENLPEELLTRVHDEYFQASVNSATGENGDLYGFPIYPDFPTIQYRRDLVEDAGYDWEQYATEPMSWERFSTELADVYEQSDVEYGFNTQHVAAEQLSCCVFNEYLTSWGGAFFGNPEDNLYQNVGERPVTVDEQPVVDSLRMARTFIHGSDAPNTLDGFGAGITPEASLQWDVEGARAPFTNGNAVALRNWPYSIVISGSEDNLGGDQGVMPMPYGVPDGEGNYPGTGGSIAALGGWHVGVNPNTERLDAIVEFLRAMTTEQFMKDTFQTTGWMPPIGDVLESSTDLPVMGEFVDTLAYAGEHSIARPVTVLWPQEADAIEQAANTALSGNGDPAEAMSNLSERLTAIEQDFEG